MSAEKTGFPLKFLILGLLFMAVPAVQGCASSEHLSPKYGQSYEAILCAQTVNPDASKDASPVDMFPGQVGESIYENYLMTFEKNAFSDSFMDMQNGL